MSIRILLCCVVGSLVIVSLGSRSSAAQSSADHDAIRRAALDYIEGFYTGDPVRMERSLHPSLAKRILRIDAAGRSQIDTQDAAQLVAITRGRQGTPPPPQQQKDVTILDVFRNAATVKVVANAWVDYLHLSRTDGQWRIVNVLWEMKADAPPPQSRALDAPAFPARAVSLPMSDIGGRPVIEVGINGKGPFRMIVDTGALRTVLSADLITELDPPAASAAAPAGPVRLAELRLGEVTIKDFVAGRGGNFLAGLGPDAPRGVLSAQAFPGAVVTFDFPGRLLMIRRGELPSADGQRIFEYGAAEPLPVVPVTLNGIDFHLHLDTGAPSTISLPTAAAKVLELDGSMVAAGTVRLPSGEFPYFEAVFDGRASIGAFPLAPKKLNFSDMRAGPRPGKGVIGMALLKNFVLSVDALNRRIRFERGGQQR